ncbi:MAG: TIGR03905 family TSCPD domain-containing protein, partial [Clostridia bacterium]|nr:TIGR03905 family TSCPD domain-containing protein [Clostridia bacterium]
SVSFMGGCHGNLQGVSALVKGRKIDEVIETLSGIKCGFKNTSCPDQLAKALQSTKDQTV